MTYNDGLNLNNNELGSENVEKEVKETREEGEVLGRDERQKVHFGALIGAFFINPENKKQSVGVLPQYIKEGWGYSDYINCPEIPKRLFESE